MYETVIVNRLFWFNGGKNKLYTPSGSQDMPFWLIVTFFLSKMAILDKNIHFRHMKCIKH